MSRAVPRTVVRAPSASVCRAVASSTTFAFRVADCEGYVTVGEYEDGRPGEVFLKVSKQGSTLAGIMDAFSISISLGLQYGVPLATYVRKFTNMRFEPAGMTDDPDLRIATQPGRLHLPSPGAGLPALEERAELGILSTGERMQPTLPGVEEAATPVQDMMLDVRDDCRRRRPDGRAARRRRRRTGNPP